MVTTIETKILLGFTKQGRIAKRQANFWVTPGKSLKFSGPQSFHLDTETIFKSYNLTVFPRIYWGVVGGQD